jgi:hypothetical protein
VRGFLHERARGLVRAGGHCYLRSVLRPIVFSGILLLALDPGLHPGPVHVDAAGARAFVFPGKSEIFIELAPVDLPAHATHHQMVQPPIAILPLPASGSLYGFRVEMVDSAGRRLPSELIHHFNLIDPDHRELFLPISRRMIAAGKETGSNQIPWFLFGFPVQRGERVLASAMLANPTSVSYSQARCRLVLLYTPARRPWPLFPAEPFQMDVAFPVGDKSFDLPPGRFSRSYEASPVVPGTIVAIGGHVHELARRLEFVDVTSSDTIYGVTPATDSAGDIIGVPVERLYRLTRLGFHIVPNHRYRVTVHYENPTSRVIPDGGMGVVGGLFVPDRGVTWPATDRTDSLYTQDLRHAMRLLGGHEMKMMSGQSMSSMHEHGGPHRPH